MASVHVLYTDITYIANQQPRELAHIKHSYFYRIIMTIIIISYYQYKLMNVKVTITSKNWKL